MTLSDDDVSEILRLIDESQLEELHIETADFKLHVLRGGTRAPEEPERPAAAAPETDGHATIEAPMVGTFYRAESPGAEPFVEVGARVEPETVVGLIEVMKMMNSIPAGVAGTIVDVCAENADVVASGQPLFRVEPTR